MALQVVDDDGRQFSRPPRPRIFCLAALVPTSPHPDVQLRDHVVSSYRGDRADFDRLRDAERGDIYSRDDASICVDYPMCRRYRSVLRRVGWHAVGLAFGSISWVYDPITASRRRVTRKRPAKARNHRKYVLFADGRHPRRIGREYHSIDGENGRRGGSLQWLTNADNILRIGHRDEFCGRPARLGKAGDRFERTINRGPCEFVKNFGNRYCI